MHAAACVFDSRQDRMGNEAASVAILRRGETPIKADYDVDKVTQQIALIYTRQEMSVFPSLKKKKNWSHRKTFSFFFSIQSCSFRLAAPIENWHLALKDATDIIDLWSLLYLSMSSKRAAEIID